jgi:hypothetical protein
VAQSLSTLLFCRSLQVLTLLVDNLGANGVHGLGLPPFMAPGPPPGESLLDGHDTQNLNAFFTDFDSNNLDPNTRVAEGAQFQDGKNMSYELPPDYVGSETSLGPRYGPSIDPQDLQPNYYSDSLISGHVPLISHGASFDGIMQPAGPGYINPPYSNPIQNPFQALVEPPYRQQWLPGYQHNMTTPISNGRPQVRFGSDDQFHASGYAAPPNHQEPDMMANLSWIEAQSSATNTQPNTRPNTVPSSPIMSRKRKQGDPEPFPPTQALNSYNGLLAQPHSMMADQLVSPAATTNARKPRKPDVKEEDEGDSTHDTNMEPALWPGSKPHPVSKPPPARRPSNRSKRKAPPSPEPAPSSSRAKTTKASGKATSKTKIPLKGTKQMPRSSTAATHRQPLTQAEKKANHTNSEQRRRDATSRAYAEMYDLVPELEIMGKLSTTKKLECVVKKVRELKAGNEELERLLGED